MKKNELKQVLKPLIKECIKECIFEDGVLSGIVSEVARGMSSNLVEVRAATSESNVENEAREKQKLEEAYEEERQKRIKKLNDSALQNVGIDIFEGTKPTLPDAPASATGSPLGGVDPGDSGVNIDGIVSLSQGKWKHLIK